MKSVNVGVPGEPNTMALKQKGQTNTGQSEERTEHSALFV